jgi:hypothetical protein
MVEILDRQAMKALYHALPASNEELAHLSWRGGAIQLKLYDQAAALIGHLEVACEDDGTEFEISLRANPLRTSLKGGLHETLDENVRLLLEPHGRMLQVTVTTGIKTWTHILPQDTEEFQMPNMAPFTKCPKINGLPAEVLKDGLDGFDESKLDFLYLRLLKTGLELEAHGDGDSVHKSTFNHSTASAELEGFSRITHYYLKIVADFGKGHGISPDTLDVALFPEGVMRFTYRLHTGKMRYWVAARFEGD